MKTKVIKVLAISVLLSLTMGCVAFATYDTNQKVSATQSALTRQQQHVVKTYNGKAQNANPIAVDVRHINGLEIINYGELTEEYASRADMSMSALNDTYFYIKNVRDNGGENLIIDRYGNVFCQEVKAKKDDRMWDIRLNKSGLADDSFVLYKSDGKFNYSFYWYTKDGDFIGQIPGDFCYTEDEVDFNDSQVIQKIKFTVQRPIQYASYSIYGMMENVLIVQESILSEGGVNKYYYYDMANDFKMIAVYTGNTNTFYSLRPPLIKNGVCYMNEYTYGDGIGYGNMTVYDDSRIKFVTFDPVAQNVDEEFIQVVNKWASTGNIEGIYQFQPSDSGWLMGEGSYGYQAYNIYTGKMVNLMSWADFNSFAGYALYWWKNPVTGNPQEFEKNGLMLLYTPYRNSGDLCDASVFNLNTGTWVNNERYYDIALYDYAERPMLYSQDPDNWWGYLNDKFQPIARYKDATTFSHGYALVSKDGWNYSVINENLQVVAENIVQANGVVNVGHGLYELKYDVGGYYIYKYVYVGPQ